MNISTIRYGGAKHLDSTIERKFSSPEEKIWTRILEDNTEYSQAFCPKCHSVMTFEELSLRYTANPTGILSRSLPPVLVNDTEITIKFECHACRTRVEAKGEGFKVD